MVMKFRQKSLSSFSTQDWLLLFQAWLLLLMVDVALRVLPFHIVQSWLKTPKRTKERPTDNAETTIRRTSDFVDRAARHHLYPMTCLRRSLVLRWLLSRQGIFAELHFGVRREQDKLQAHAWLEYQGQPIGEREALTNQYMPLKANETPEAPNQPIF
jgi:hypothetical protein